MEFQPSLIRAGCCIDISGVFVQRDNGRGGNKGVSKAFDTSVQVDSSGIEIVDDTIDLSKERNERRFEPLVERCVTVNHLDVAFENCLEGAV